MVSLLLNSLDKLEPLLAHYILYIDYSVTAVNKNEVNMENLYNTIQYNTIHTTC